MSTDRLTDALEALERIEPPIVWADVESRLDEVRIPPGRREGSARSWRPALVVAGVGSLLVGLLALWPGSPQPVRTAGPPVVGHGPPTALYRWSAVVVSTDEELLVWSGGYRHEEEELADGFAVDPVSGSIRQMAEAPIGPRTSATGVWSGRELLVCCGRGQADGGRANAATAAAWSPESETWRILTAPPEAIARAHATSVWTGELMVVIAPGPAAAVYDVDEDRWTEIEAPPLLGQHPQAIWTGAELVLWDARFGSWAIPPDGAIADRGWRWSPGDRTWSPLPELPQDSRTQLGSVGWTGEELVVWGSSSADPGLGVGAVWRPGDDHWAPISPFPGGRVDAFDGTPGSQAVAPDTARQRVLVRGLQGNAEAAEGATAPLQAYDPSTDTWAPSNLDVQGHHPQISVLRDRVLLPDAGRPIAGFTS